VGVTENSTSDLSEVFDVVVINLTDETDRRSSSLREVRKLGLEPRFVVAEDGLSTNHRDNPFLRSGASACFASHIKAWEDVSKGKKKYTIIVEDDIQIRHKDKFIKLLGVIENSSLEVIQVGFLNTGLRQVIDVKLQNIEVKLIRLVSNIFSNRFSQRLRVRRNSALPKELIADDFRAGAHCYILTPHVASQLVSNVGPPVITLDAYLMALSWHQAFRVARVKNSLAGQKDFPSRIKSS
jgi:GR25 family glycosyltransferase involved in LPS biosynthesis